MADPLHAKHFTTGPWDVVQTADHVPRSLHGKRPKPITGKLGMIDIAARADETDNFSLLHRKIQPTSVNYQTQPIRLEKIDLSDAKQTMGSIRESIQKSPAGVKASEERIQYLYRAKLERINKLKSRQLQTKSQTPASPVSKPPMHFNPYSE